MFEKDENYRKARKASKERISKVIRVWSAREETLHDEGFKKGAEFGYNKAFIEADKNLKAVVTDFNKAKEESKTIIQDLLNNSDEYARQRAMDWLKEVE